MMEQKMIPEYEYLGLGFPIKLKNVICLKIHEQWHPKIDVEKVADDAFHHLIEKASTSPLTGNEIEFIRTYLNLSKKAFGEKFNVAHTTISRWEKAGNQVPKTKKNYQSLFQELAAFA
jgi:DNA-binding transcriptional regulator YiaG